MKRRPRRAGHAPTMALKGIGSPSSSDVGRVSPRSDIVGVAHAEWHSMLGRQEFFVREDSRVRRHIGRSTDMTHNSTT